MSSLRAKNPNLIVTACPMCKKAFKRASDFTVKDVAEIVKENIISE
jgi:Fe-S oxidoreductase